MLKWAGAVFIPVLLGLMLSYTLSPLVNRLQRWRVPRALSAAVLLLGIVAGTGSLLYSLSDDATALIESLPEAAQKLRVSLRSPRQAPPGADRQRAKGGRRARARRRGERDARRGRPTRRDARHDREAPIPHQGLPVDRHARPGRARRSDVAVVFLITYFLLASGDSFRARWSGWRVRGFEPEENHPRGARRDHRADPTLPSGAAVHERDRRHRHLARVRVDRPGARRRLGARGGRHQSDSLPRRRDHRRPARRYWDSCSSAGSTWRCSSAPRRSPSTASSAIC